MCIRDRIKEDSPAGSYLQSHQVAKQDFNSYGSRRGNHDVMMRGTFANIRIKNEMVPGVEGGVTTYNGEQMPIYDAAMKHKEDGTPLVVVAGKEYGTGSSRDWAAKGTILLGVKAVIVESYERIHRSNLIGMGVLPLQFPAGESHESLGLDGTETTCSSLTVSTDSSDDEDEENGHRRRRRRGRPSRPPHMAGARRRRAHPHGHVLQYRPQPQ